MLHPARISSSIFEKISRGGTDLKTRLEEILEALVAGRGVAGVAVAVRGEAQPEAVWVPSPDQEEPAFLAYSITKTFTAVLFLLLQEEGRLTLDDSLARWFPRITGAEQISLRHLLHHTAGIPDYGPWESLSCPDRVTT